MWTMYMQLFFTLPVFITQWIDTSDAYNLLPDFLAPVLGFKELGIIRPEMLINVPALTIIMFQVIMSNRLKKVRPIVSMIFGIVVLAAGFAQISIQTSGLFVVLALFIFAFGEMASSPRIQEYIGRIAPKEKVALYMGYGFLPVAGGNVLGGLLSGSLYESLSDKYGFLKDYLITEGLQTKEQISQVDGGILFNQTMNQLNLSATELDQLLYSQYQPGNIWLVFAAIGIVTSLLLFTYDKFILKQLKN